MHSNFVLVQKRDSVCENKIKQLVDMGFDVVRISLLLLYNFCDHILVAQIAIC